MTEICQVKRLGMDHSVEICPAGTHLIVMDGKMRIKFTGDALKPALIRSVKLSGLSAVIDNDARNAGWGVPDELPQTPSGATHEKRSACQLRDRLRQVN